jgi:hypothetical protein
MDTIITSKKKISNLAGGLFMMSFFTVIWVIIAEIVLYKFDHFASIGVFGVMVAYFIINYFKLTGLARTLPDEETENNGTAEKIKNRNFYIIFTIEAFAIFIAKNALVNTGHDNYFFPVFALIVGLHFFPLAMLFKRRFYYVIAVWVCMLAILGFVLTYKSLEVNIVTSIIAIGCALATTVNGIRMVMIGEAIMNQD